MANPFLFMEDDTIAVSGVCDAFSNPFLVDDDEGGEEFPNDNPFSTSNPFAFNDIENEDEEVATTTAAEIFSTDTVTQSGANLFLVEDDHEQHIDPTMSFFGTTINECDGLQYQKPNDLNLANENEIFNEYATEDDTKAKKPPRPNPPPSHVTQQLITTLTDHLDQTSTNLLGKLPVTRSPSPVSMRDLHSPDVDDLLDVSDSFAHAQPTENNFSNVQSIVSNHEVEHKPSRPPPPRPVPPRPTPPKGSQKSSPVTASTPIQPENTTTVTQANINHQEDDLFDVFGTGHQKKMPPPKPPAPKSNQDILSLFSAPTPPTQPPQKPDYLSDDIDFSVQHETNVAVVPTYDDTHATEKIPEENIPEEAIVEPVVEENIFEPEIEEEEKFNITYKMQIPTIEMDLTPDLPNSDDEQDVVEEPAVVNEPVKDILPDHSPSDQPGITSGGIPDFESTQEQIFAQEQPQYQESSYQIEQQEEQNPFAVKALTPPEQLEQLEFLTQGTTTSEYYQRPTTPDPIVAQPELAPIFNIGSAPQPVNNVLSSPKPNPPPPPVRGGSVLTSIQQPVSNFVPEIAQSDEFDDFAAKFESKTQVKTTGNAFLDSLEQDTIAPVVVDAWGPNDAFGVAPVVAAHGFENEDDGFDTWNPPPKNNRRYSGSDEEKEFKVEIKPKGNIDFGIAAPILGPPVPQRSPYSGSNNSEGKSQINL